MVPEPIGHGQPTSPKRSGSLTQIVDDSSRAVARPHPSGRRPRRCGPTTSPAQSTTPRERSTVPIDAVTRPHRSSRRPLGSSPRPHRYGHSTAPKWSATPRVRCSDLTLEDADLTVPVHCPNRFRHLTPPKKSATIWVRLVDHFGRNFDRIAGVVNCTREVVVSFREVIRPFEGGAPSPTERSTTISVRSTT
jgi:hypothetical protein